MYWKVVVPILLIVAPAMARDDGRYSGSPLHEWFDSLQSKIGRCCADADGTVVVDAIGKAMMAITGCVSMATGTTCRTKRSSRSPTATGALSRGICSSGRRGRLRSPSAASCPAA
jgi:hypothetical protein